MISNSFKAAVYCFSFKCLSLIKVSFMLGSHMIWFSGVNSILPLSGAFGGIMGANLAFLMRQLMHLVFFKTISLSFFALCIPGFFASIYWTSSNIFIRLILPLTCMALFVMHPVGGQAFIYSLYWLIPVVLYFVPQRSLFLTALGSTFIAHAVGSVIWCYTVPMTTGMWMALMSVVLYERLLFALGMVIMHRVLSAIFSTFDMTEQKTIMCKMQC